MEKLISCAFNMDTACVELRFTDGSICFIDCTAVENEVADNGNHAAVQIPQFYASGIHIELTRK